MEEKFDKELANKIRALVDETSPEPYEIGAWENFEARTFGSKRNLLRFAWIGLAASFLMAMSVNTIYNSTDFDSVRKSSSFSFETLENTVPMAVDYNSVTAKDVKVEPITKASSVYSNNAAKENRNIRLVHFNSPSYPVLQSSIFPQVFFDSELPMNVQQYPSGIKFSSGFIPTSDSKSGKKEKINQRQIKVGIALGSALNSIGREKSGCSVNGGIMTDIPLFKGMALSTGLLVNAQRINFESNLSGERVKTEGRLVSVDLPVNLKYNVCQKTDKLFFVSAGVSSLAYLKEDFKEEGRKEDLNNYEESKGNSFNGLDLAKFINLSMGVEIPLEKQLSILIEPYLKYPLGGSTSREIKYASAGLSFRLNMGLALLN